MPSDLHLLVVDDDEQKRRLLARVLRREFDRARVTECVSGEAAIQRLQQHSVTAVVTNHSMQPVDGIELTQWIRSRDPALPILMVTGDPHIAALALRHGVDRVIDFARFQEVGPTLRTLIAGRSPTR
jgi:CheY-like chemotaxis protein